MALIVENAQKTMSHRDWLASVRQLENGEVPAYAHRDYPWLFGQEQMELADVLPVIEAAEQLVFARCRMKNGMPSERSQRCYDMLEEAAANLRAAIALLGDA